MRFLVDEMFSAEVGRNLAGLGHDAVHVVDVGLGHAEDTAVMAYAVGHQWVVVTENAADFVELLRQRTADGHETTPVVVALKHRLPRGAGALAHHLAVALDRWAETNPAPYPHAHWLP